MAMFDPAYAPYLDTPERRKALPIKEVLRYLLALKMNRRIAVDIGAGTGYLTILLSWIFKKVYAVEANQKMAKLLMKNLEGRGTSNVEIILSSEPPKLPERPNLVAFSLSLHEIENWRDYLRWALKADYVLIIEWCLTAERGPPKEEKIPREELLNMEGVELVLSRIRFPYYLVILKRSKN